LKTEQIAIGRAKAKLKRLLSATFLFFPCYLPVRALLRIRRDLQVPRNHGFAGLGDQNAEISPLFFPVLLGIQGSQAEFFRVLQESRGGREHMIFGTIQRASG
jgi:hypothetical protein